MSTDPLPESLPDSLPNPLSYKVRAVHCNYQASDEEVYQALKRATDPLTETWERLRRASTIAIKFNQDKPRERWVFFEGQLQQLVSTKVFPALW